jgi:hypothetical protein
MPNRHGIHLIDVFFFNGLTKSPQLLVMDLWGGICSPVAILGAGATRIVTRTISLGHMIRALGVELGPSSR